MKTLVQINKKKNSLINGISNQVREIVILDPTIPDSHHIASGIKPGTATYILESQADAVEQIATILAQHTGITALHIISHGSSGSLYLGTTELNSSNCENYSQQLQQWRNSLTDNADIILYGCNSAAGDRGHKFLTLLHQLTGANIAANPYPTGNSQLGGNWDIPQLIPPSPEKPKLALTETTLKTYSGVLGFAAQVPFFPGQGPVSVSLGDFNLDEKPDLAVANSGSDNASILLNTTTTNATTPTFATKVDFPTGTRPFSVSIGDINLDGKPDLAVANLNSNTASILLNTTAPNATTPTFATKVDFSTGSNPASVSIGDFNLDGKPDIAVANLNSDTASILLNTTTTNATTPTFATKVDFSTGSNPRSVSMGDFNVDGKPDIAVANRGSNTASILLNTTTTNATTPTFATKVDFPTGTGPYSVSMGDFNGDGKSDLATANYNSSDVSILLNTTTTNATTPTFATKVDFPTGNSPRSVSVGDINGDGLPDLATANRGSSNTSILLNTTTTNATTPTFAPQVPFPTGNGSASVSIGDINGDKKLDLAVANGISNTASILLHTTPKVTAVTANIPDGRYGIGATIPIMVFFDVAVNVTGTPRLQLETGTTDSFATYTSGSDGMPIFNYVVQAGDTSLDLEYLATNALTLNGGTITDNLADAVLTLPALASANSLGGRKAIVIDGVAPTVVLTSASTTTVNGLFNVTATFSENVTGFDNTDITVANANVGNFVRLDAKTYTFDVTPTADGNVTVDVLADKAKDTAGNNNTAATGLTRTADITAPNITLTSASPTTTNAPFLVTATFSESVTGFMASDVNLTNSTISGFTGSGTTYNFTVTPNADGPVTVDVPAATATDIANNNNTAATQLTRTTDFTPPTVALTSASPTTTNAPFLVTATFSESVTGFMASDVNLTNSTISGFTGSGTTYNFTVTPNASGPVTVNVPAATATDIAGNNNTAATQLTRTADITAPTVALTSASPTTTNAPFLVTATFSESVTGFMASDVNLTNSTISGFTGSGTTYNFTVTPNASGPVTVDVPAATATDIANNNNTAATQLTRTADITAPTVALTSASPTTTNAPFLVTATFSESVTGFIASDVNLTNSTISGFTGSGTSYTFTVTPNADGPVTVNVPAATATDIAGNNNTAATELTRTYDATAPTVALTSTSSTTVNEPFSVTATFSENVKGFDNTDITLANATVDNFVTLDAKTYSFDVTPAASGNVTVDVPAAIATDTAGNNNTAATPLVRTANVTTPDITPPTVALTSTSTPTVTGLFSVTATFSENVNGFDNTDITVANATVSNFVTLDATNYSFDVTPAASGNVTVDVPAAIATDTAGNNNTAATPLVRTANVTTSDITPPTVALTSTSTPTVTGLFSVTATFSENVNGFDNTDITVANATIDNFVTLDAKTYSFDVTPAASGNVTVDVPAAIATDTAGNNNTAATPLVRTANVTTPIVDVIPPTPNLSAISNITNSGGTSQTFTVTFSESNGVDVSSLDNSDVVINWSGGAIGATFISATPTGNGTPRTATYSLTPPGGTWDSVDNGTYTVNLQASQVKDVVGNLYAASNLGTFSVNVAPPAPAPTPPAIPTPVPSVTPTPAPTIAEIPAQTSAQTPTPRPTIAPTPTTNNIPNDDCICDDIAYPNLNQPNRVENTILGVLGIQIGTAKNEEFLGSNRGDIFDAFSGDDNLYGGSSDDILNGNTGNDFISGGTGDDILFGDQNNDIILGDLGKDLIFGGKGNDSINSREGDDIVYGNRNDDFIDGGKEDDTLFGGKGNDIVLGSQGDDYFFGNQGSDTICGGESNDFISGNESADILGGCEGNDTMYGGEDNDTLTGCQGDDIVYGDLGNDSLTGGSGNDIFVLNSGQGFDVIADFTSGQDLMGLSGGLSFGQLEITQNTQGTIIKNVWTGEELGVMIGVSANAITSANFRLI